MCDSSVAFAAIVRKVCRKLSLNGSALKDEMVTKVCPTFHFGTKAVPRKRSHLFLKELPFLLVVPVLAATLSWRNGQRDDKPFSEQEAIEFAMKVGSSHGMRNER